MWYYYPRGPVCVTATAIASTEKRPQVEGVSLFILGSWPAPKQKAPRETEAPSYFQP